MDLAELVFKVNTSDLEKANKAIVDLTAAVKGLDAESAKAAVQAAKVEAARAREAVATAKAEGAAVKLAEAKARLVKAEAEADAATNRAAAAQTKAAAEGTKAELATTRLAKAKEDLADKTKNSVSIQERQNDILSFMTEGFSRGQSTILSYAKAAGEATGEIGKILDLQRQLMGGDPFDKSLSALKLYTNAVKEAEIAQRLINDGYDITIKQAKEIARQEMAQAVALKVRGAAEEETAIQIKNKTEQTVRLAEATKRAEDAEKARLKAMRDAAAGAKYVADTDARLAAALDATNDQLDRRSTDTMVKYRAALAATGMSSEQAAAKMEILKGQLDAVASKEREQQLRYLARAVSVQMGDVAISLASGMNPFLVMIQQGDQIRGALQQVGASGDELSKAMTQGASMIARGFIDTATAIGTFFAGAVKSAGRAVVDFFIAPMQYATAVVLDYVNGTKRAETAALNLKDAMLNFAKFGAAAAAAALAVLALEYIKIIKAETELSRSLAMTGAMLGLTKEQAVQYSKELSNVAGSTLKVQQVITEMGRVGKLGSDSIKLVTEAAVNLEKYGGVAIADTVKRFSEISDKPVEGLIKLGKETGNVTVSVIEQVKALIDQKKYADASALAIRETARAMNESANQMKNDLSPIETLWLEIKSRVDQAREAIYNLVTSDAVIKAFSVAWQTVAVIIADTFYVLKQMGITLGGVAALLGAIANRDWEGAGRIAGLMKTDSAAAREEQDKLIAGIMRLDKTQEDATVKAMQRHREEADSRMRRANEVAEYERRLADEKKDKSGKAGGTGAASQRTASGSLAVTGSNELSEIQKRFNNELQLAKNYGAEERQLLKARFDAGLIERGQFITEDTALLAEGERQQLAIVAKYEEQMAAAQTQRIIEMIRAREKALAANKGLKDEGKAESDINKQFWEELSKINEIGITSAQVFDNLRASIAATVKVRQEMRSLDFDKATFENTKNYIAMTNSIRDQNQERRLDLELQRSLVGVSAEVGVRLKAEYDEMKRLTPEIRKFADEVIRAKRELDQVMNAPESDPKVIEAAQNRYRNAVLVSEQVIKDARVQAQNAGTDAVVAYYQQEFKRISDTLSDAIADALFNGGKSGSKKIRDLIVAELKKPVTLMVQAVVNPILGSVMSAFGFGSPTSGATGGSTGNALGNAASAVSAGKGLMDVVTLGFTGAVAQQMNKLIFSEAGRTLGLSSVNYTGFSSGATTGGLSTTAGAGGLNPAATSTGGITATASGSVGSPEITKLGSTVKDIGISLVAGYIGGQLRKTIANGYRLGGSGEKILDVVNILAGFKNPITQLVVGALSGLVSRAFGRKLTEVGVMGTFGGDAGFQGQQYTFEKGGWFRSDRQKTSPLDPELTQGLADQFNTVRASIAQMAIGLGEGVDSIISFTKEVKVNLKGLSEDEALKALEQEFLTVQEELAGVVLGTTNYSKANETNLQTLTRLYETLGTVNSAFDNLGFQLFDLSLANADAAQSFVELFGTMDKFKEATSKYYENFYTEDEKIQNLTRQLTTAFANLGLQLPRSIEEFRKLGDAAMASGDQALFAGIISVQDQFLSLMQKTAKTGEDLMGSSGSYVEYMRKKAGIIPTFADGGSYKGGLALVGEQGPELIDFKQPGYIYNAAETASIMSSDSSSSVVTELQNLRQEVSYLRAEVRADVSHNAKTARLLDRVIPDGDSILVTVGSQPIDVAVTGQPISVDQVA